MKKVAFLDWRESLKPSVLAAVHRARHRYRSERNRRQRLKLGRYLLADLGFAADGNPLPGHPEPSDQWRRISEQHL